MNRVILLTVSVFCFSLGYSQELLTQDKAIELALVNNNLLQVSRKSKDITSTNVTLGNAGFMPTVNLAITNNLSNTQLHQKIFTAALNSTTDTRKDGVIQTTWNGGLNMNWVLFNGMRRINMYQRLRDTYEQANAQTKSDIENTIANTTKAYLEVLRQQEIAQAYQNNLDLYRERLRLAEARLSIGLVSKSDVLISKVDINTQRAILITQQTFLENARLTINQLLNREPTTAFTVLVENRKPATDTNKAYTGKTTILITTQKAIDIATRQYKEANATYMPLLSFVGAYNFAQSASSAGQTRLNQTLGPNAGFALSWSLFDGFNKNRNRKTGMLNIEVNEYLHQDNIRTQATAYYTALIRYRNAIKIFELESESYDLAKESSDIARERYVTGNLNLFGYKDTQLVLESTKVRLANARYDALSAEVDIIRLNGELVK